MSKELTPLEAFKELLIINDVPTITPIPSLVDEPITSLEQTRKAYRNRELRDIIKNALKELDFYKKRDKQWKQDVNRNIDKLKALEIIKKIICITSDDFFDETIGFKREKLTQEEFDLLKEVLGSKTLTK